MDGPEKANDLSGMSLIAVRQHAGQVRSSKKIRRGSMNFIERIFGISPDGGSGALEFLLFLIPMAGVCVIFTLKFLRSKRSR